MCVKGCELLDLCLPDLVVSEEAELFAGRRHFPDWHMCCVSEQSVGVGLGWAGRGLSRNVPILFWSPPHPSLSSFVSPLQLPSHPSKGDFCPSLNKAGHLFPGLGLQSGECTEDSLLCLSESLMLRLTGGMGEKGWPETSLLTWAAVYLLGFHLPSPHAHCPLLPAGSSALWPGSRAAPRTTPATSLLNLTPTSRPLPLSTSSPRSC